jgi:hypothetical protein
MDFHVSAFASQAVCMSRCRARPNRVAQTARRSARESIASDRLQSGGPTKAPVPLNGSFRAGDPQARTAAAGRVPVLADPIAFALNLPFPTSLTLNGSFSRLRGPRSAWSVLIQLHHLVDRRPCHLVVRLGAHLGQQRRSVPVHRPALPQAQAARHVHRENLRAEARRTSSQRRSQDGVISGTSRSSSRKSAAWPTAISPVSPAGPRRRTAARGHVQPEPAAAAGGVAAARPKAMRALASPASIRRKPSLRVPSVPRPRRRPSAASSRSAPRRCPSTGWRPG